MVEDLCSSGSFFLLEVLDFLPHQAGMATRRRRTTDEREKIRIGERSRRSVMAFRPLILYVREGKLRWVTAQQMGRRAVVGLSTGMTW